MRTSSLLLVTALMTFSTVGCGGPTYVRGGEVEGLDDAAMSTGLDKRDLEKLLHETMASMLNSTAAKNFQESKSRPRLAIYPLANETSEHIDSQLQALLSDIENYMVESDMVDVISVERQRQMMAEVDIQHGGGFDPTKISAYNKQMGAEYYITGKVFSSDERTAEGRRVQYFMFMQMIEVATSAIKWQHKSALTKALIDA